MSNFESFGEYLFVTVDEEGKIGSVYFEHGRIRLVHKSGPKVSLNTTSKFLYDKADGSKVNLPNPLSIVSLDEAKDKAQSHCLYEEWGTKRHTSANCF